MAQDNKTKNKKVLTVVGVVLVLFIIIGIAGGSDTPQQNNSNDTSQQQTTEQPEAKTISQSDAENVCQDANFLQNYINLDDTSIVTLSYNPTFTDMGDGTKSLQWNGKDKPSDSSILFVCDVALNGDKVEVQYLAIDGDTVYEQ